MTNQGPEDVVNAFIAAIGAGDVDAALALMSDDCEYDNVPISKSIGHEQIRSTLAMFVSKEAPAVFEIVRQVAHGDVVMNERVDRLSIGGKHVALGVAGVFEVRDGKIALWRDYFDMGQFTSQMA